MNFWELLQELNWIGIIGWIVSAASITGLTLVWNTFKKGRKSYKYYYEAKQGGWTSEEKEKYIEKTAEFWSSINSLWSAIKAAFKSWV